MTRSFAILSLFALTACGEPAPATDVAPAAPATEAPATEAAAAPATEAAPAAEVAWQHAGEAFTLTDKVAVTDLLAAPESFVGKTVRVEADAADVCSKKGCWLVIADGDKTMRIMSKDHAFGIEPGAVGARVDLEGTVVKKEHSAADAAHFASEAAKPEVAPKGEGQGATYEIVANGIAWKAPQKG